MILRMLVLLPYGLLCMLRGSEVGLVEVQETGLEAFQGVSGLLYQRFRPALACDSVES